MIVNRNFAKFLGVIFALEFLILITFILEFFIPDFHFSNNYIVRIVFLFIIIFMGVVFYSYISLESEISEKTKEDRGFFLIKGEIEYIKLIAIIIVFAIFLYFITDLMLHIFNII